MSQMVAKRRILVPLMSLFLVCTRGWAQTIDTVPLTDLTGLQKQLTGLDQELRGAWDILRHGPPSIDDYCQAIGDHVLPTLEGVSDKVYASTKGLAREDAAVRRSIKRLEELRAASSGRVAATYDQMIKARKVRREHIAAARDCARKVIDQYIAMLDHATDEIHMGIVQRSAGMAEMAAEDTAGGHGIERLQTQLTEFLRAMREVATSDEATGATTTTTRTTP